MSARAWVVAPVGEVMTTMAVASKTVLDLHDDARAVAEFAVDVSELTGSEDVFWTNDTFDAG